MSMTSTKTLLLSTAAAVLALGCQGRTTTSLNPPGGGGSTPTPVEVNHQGIRASAESNLKALFKGVVRANDIFDESDFLPHLGIAPDAAGKRACHGETEPGGGGGTGVDPGERDPVPCDEDPDQTPEERAQEMAEEIVMRLFHDDDVEATEATRVTYRLDPDRVCSDIKAKPGRTTQPAPDGQGNNGGGGDNQPPPDDGGDGRVAPPDDPSDCEREFTNNPVRLGVTSRRDGDLDVSVLVGEQQVNVATLSLHQSRVAIEIDLGAVASVWSVVSGLMGGEGPPAPDVMQGVIVISLVDNGSNDYTAELAITRAIQIQSNDAETPYGLTIGRSTPAVSVQLDGDAERITTTFGVGPVDASGPLQIVDELFEDDCAPTATRTSGGGSSGENPGAPAPPPPDTDPPDAGCGGTDRDLTGTLAAHLAGFSGAAIITNTGVEVTGLGIGGTASSVTFNGLPLITADFNETMGRATNGSAAETSEGIQTAFQPGVDLKVGLQLSRIADQLEVPEWAQDEELQVTFDGHTTPTLVVLKHESRGSGSTTNPTDPDGGERPVPPPPPEPEQEAAARIVNGLLAFHAKNIDAPVTVPAGSCLFVDDSGDNAPGPQPVPPPEGGEGGDSGGGSTGSGSTGGGSTPGYVPEEDRHPFAALSAGPCPQ